MMNIYAQYENEFRLAFRITTLLITTPLLFAYIYPKYIEKEELPFVQMLSRIISLTVIVCVVVAIIVAVIVYCIIPYIFFNIY